METVFNPTETLEKFRETLRGWFPLVKREHVQYTARMAKSGGLVAGSYDSGLGPCPEIALCYGGPVLVRVWPGDGYEVCLRETGKEVSSSDIHEIYARVGKIARDWDSLAGVRAGSPRLVPADFISAQALIEEADRYLIRSAGDIPNMRSDAEHETVAA